MLNKNEQRKQIKSAVHKDMVVRVDPAAEVAFRREPYQTQGTNVKSMIELKKDINIILNRHGLLDSWEQETIKRIARRIQEGRETVGQENT